MPSAQEIRVFEVLGVTGGLTGGRSDHPRCSAGAMPEDPADTLGWNPKNLANSSIGGADPVLVQAVQNLFEAISALHGSAQPQTPS